VLTNKASAAATEEATTATASIIYYLLKHYFLKLVHPLFFKSHQLAITLRAATLPMSTSRAPQVPRNNGDTHHNNATDRNNNLNNH
jgi:hypothetical protein